MGKRKLVLEDEIKNKRKKKEKENLEISRSNDNYIEEQKNFSKKSSIRTLDTSSKDVKLNEITGKEKKQKKHKSMNISDQGFEEPSLYSNVIKSDGSLRIKNKSRIDKSKNNKSLEDISDSDYHKESINDKLSKSQSRKKRKRITDLLASNGPTPPKPSDLINEISKHFEGKLTKLELENISINESNIALCNDLTHTEISFLKSLFPKWKKTVEKCIDLPRRPLLLIICLSGIRCVNYIRAISEFKIKGCKIAKLFAKHLKVEDQQKFLQQNTIHIAVGTPNRLNFLLQNGDLSLDHLKYVIVDWSHRDSKQLRMIDQEQMRRDLMSLLHQSILPNVRSQQFKIALF